MASPKTKKISSNLPLLGAIALELAVLFFAMQISPFVESKAVNAAGAILAITPSSSSVVDDSRLPAPIDDSFSSPNSSGQNSGSANGIDGPGTSNSANGIDGPGTSNSTGDLSIDSPLKYSTLSGFLDALLKVVINIGYLVAVFFIIYSGFKFVMAQGNEGEITKAKEMLLWTVIGTAILIGAHVIARAIEATINAL